MAESKWLIFPFFFDPDQFEQKTSAVA